MSPDRRRDAYTGLGMMNVPRDTPAQLQAMGLVGKRFPPVTISTPYRLELALGALVTSLFPLAYGALISLVAWGVYSLVSTSGLVRGTAPSIYSRLSMPVILLLGCCLILSLLKPLVARPGRTVEPHFLDSDKEPLLFAFVKELGSAGGMPEPSGIAVDCSVNSCSIFAGGIAGIFRSGLTLVVGLPLVAGLRLDQFAVVLAHELGHAAQATATWPGRFIWTVSAWFSRVACEPDQFDERLLTRLETAGMGAQPALRLVQWLVQPGRGLLRLLMWVETVASSVFLRHMEREADRYQVRVTGTDAFVSTLQEVNLLAVAAQGAVVKLSHLWREGRLVDNYPGLIASLRGRYSDGFVGRLLAGLERRRAGIFNAHPSDRDRMALARGERARGILSTDLPATVLFADYNTLCREVTLEFYDYELRLPRNSCQLVPLESVFKEGE